MDCPKRARHECWLALLEGAKLLEERGGRRPNAKYTSRRDWSKDAIVAAEEGSAKVDVLDALHQHCERALPIILKPVVKVNRDVPLSDGHSSDAKALSGRRNRRTSLFAQRMARLESRAQVRRVVLDGRKRDIRLALLVLGEDLVLRHVE